MEDEDAGFFCDVIDEGTDALKLDWLWQEAVPLAPSKGEYVIQAVGKKNVFWKRNQTAASDATGPLRLGVGFLDGAKALQDHVLRLAAEWTGPNGANVAFYRQDDVEAADIRITFDTAMNHSVKGNEANLMAKSEPTMHLAHATLQGGVPTARMKAVVRHEFGHALGLSHEHTHPAFPYVFDEDAILADLLGKAWGQCQNGEQACRKSIRDFITTKLSSTTTDKTPAFDKTSIMTYPIKAHWLQSGTPIAENTRISKDDLAFVKKMYP